jgi:hypothetical protein
VTAGGAKNRKIRWGQALLWASVASWIVYIAFALLAAVFETYFQADPRIGIIGYTFALAVLGFPFALAISLPIGLLALLIAEFVRLTKWWQAALLGAAGGVLATPIILIAFGTFRNLQFDARMIIPVAIFSVAGACAGATAWGSLWLDGKYRNAARQPEA